MPTYRETTPDGKLLVVQGHPTLADAIRALQANLNHLIDAGFTVNVASTSSATAHRQGLYLVLTASE